MCIECYLWFIACSVLVVNGNVLNDLQEARKFMEQLDYDYSGVAADAALQQMPAAADLLWYDYGGVGGGSTVGGSSSPVTALLIGGDKRAGGTTQSNSGNIWFGPRLGRRKRRGGGGSSFNGAVPGGVQPVDANAIEPIAPQETVTVASVTTAAEQADVSNLIKHAPWILVPIIENTSYNQMKQNTRTGRSSSEDDDEADPSSRHMARSPPYSPPFSPRLGRQSIALPHVPRLGRQAFLYRRDARSASYQQTSAATLRQPSHHGQQQPASPAATVAATRLNAVA